MPVRGQFLVGGFAELGLYFAESGSGILHVPFFQGTAVDNGIRAESAADGFFHILAQPQNPVHIIAMLNPHFIDLNQGVFQTNQAHIPGVVIIVPGSPGGAVIQEIGGLSAHAAQRGFKMGDSGLK